MPLTHATQLHYAPVVRRTAAILLCLFFAALGSGALEALHNLEHAREDARIAAAAARKRRTAVDHHHEAHAHQDAHGRAAHHDHFGHHPHHAPSEHLPSEEPPTPIHDETNCELHALLNLPLLPPALVVVLILLGLLVAFLTLLPHALVSGRVPMRIDCRGPPAFRFA